VELELIRREITASTFLPWHRNVDVAADDYLRHVDAWLAQYKGLASAEGFEAMNTVERGGWITIRTTFEIAEQSTREAVPSLFAGDLPERLNDVFAS
jgi:hypothetical protein